MKTRLKASRALTEQTAVKLDLSAVFLFLATLQPLARTTKANNSPPATLTAGVFCRQAPGTLRTFEPYESLKRFRACGNYTNGKWMRDSTAVPRLHVKKRGRVVDQRKEFAAPSSLHEGATAERIAKKAKLFDVSLQKHRALRLTLGLLSLCPTLTDLEARIALANHIKTAATSHHLAIWVTKL